MSIVSIAFVCVHVCFLGIAIASTCLYPGLFFHMGSGAQTQILRLPGKCLTNWKQGGGSRQPWVLGKLLVCDHRLNTFLLPPQEEMMVATMAQTIGEGSSPSKGALSDPHSHPTSAKACQLHCLSLLSCFLAVWSRPRNDTQLLWKHQWGLRRWV